VVTWSSLSAGECVRSADKIYGNFVGGNLPSDTVLIFNTNVVGSIVHQQLSFDGTYLSGTTYNWGYEVAVNFAVAPSKTIFTSVDSDFTQTASDGASTLDKRFNPAGDHDIHEVKIGAEVQPGSVLSTNFGPGVTDLVVSETLADSGTISSVTNTLTEFSPGNNIPEPLTLALMGAGLVGLRLVRRRKA
jgi:CxxC motif-containing protein